MVGGEQRWARPKSRWETKKMMRKKKKRGPRSNRPQ